MIKNVAKYSNILLILTSIHHIYGAAVYHTPWRLHVLIFSIPLLLFQILLVKRTLRNQFWYFLFWVSIILFSVIHIGLFEGVYNHILKDLLYFSDGSPSLMNRLFPSPIYEMPNDFFFEFTGVLQGVIVVPLIWNCFKSLRKVEKPKLPITPK